MAFNIKKVNENKRNYSADNFSDLFPKKKKDYLFRVLFYVIALAVTLGIIIEESIRTINYYFYYDPATVIVSLSIVYVLLITFFIFFAVALFGDERHKMVGEHMFYLYTDKKDYKIVKDFSEQSVGVHQEKVSQDLMEVDENGDPIYYAEELFDDEENIFVSEVNSTLIQKEKTRTYDEIAKDIDETMAKYGLKGNLGRAIISSMNFSPMIYVGAVAEHIETIFKAFNNPGYVIHYSSNSSINNERVLYNCFDYAKTHSDIPVFIYIDEIPAKEFLKYMRSLYTYIDNPNDDYYLSTNGATSLIPHNVYFLINLTKDSVLFDISRRYLRYISVLEATLDVCEKAEEVKPFTFTVNELNVARRSAMEDHALDESSFKKLDNIFSILKDATGYILQNKIQRKIEAYSATLLALDEKEDGVLDDCLANNVINAAIITAEVKKLDSEYHLIRNIESEFGSSKMKKTKAIIKQYISLFGVDGGKKDE